MKTEPSGLLTVTTAEDGIKLLRFLERRLTPDSAVSLHKWIRTGQVRVNGKRSKPFDALHCGDSIRIPPFALPRQIEQPLGAPEGQDGIVSMPPLPPAFFTGGVTLVGSTTDYMVLGKPSGLAVQGGSGTKDSIAGRLKKVFHHAPFIPAPVHRLDKQTSGLLLTATTQRGSTLLSAAFQNASIRKEYLAVVQGRWEWAGTRLLLDDVSNEKGSDGKERMVCAKKGTCRPLASKEDLQHVLDQIEGNPAAACLLARPLGFAMLGQQGTRPCTLLHIRLLTGKKHQIRTQLAHQGYPILGDPRYGGMPWHPMLLHAMSLTLPDGTNWRQLPDWAPPLQDIIARQKETLAAPWTE